MPTTAVGGRWLLVRLGEHRLGLPMEAVREVVPGRARYTPLPGAGAYAVGVDNLRGRLLTVLDLGVLVVGQPAASGEHSVVVVETEGRVFGLAVAGVERMVTAEVEPADALRAFGFEGAFVRGLGALPDGAFVALAPEVWARSLFI